MFEALLPGANTLRIVFLVNDHCITTQCTSLCLVILFVLKFTLSTINITHSVFLFFFENVCMVDLVSSFYFEVTFLGTVYSWGI